MAAIPVTEAISIDDSEIEESFIRAGGPGGQNVNKVATAVQLRFDVRGSRSLPNDVAVRLMALAGSRVTQEGVLVITAQKYRTQERNRADALERLVELIRKASVPPVKRHKTRPSKAAKQERLQAKARRAGVKSLRRRVGQDN